MDTAGLCAVATSPALLALREPSRWMMTSAPFIIRRVWPDRMLPTRSGTGASSTSGSGAVAGTLLLQVQTHCCLPKPKTLEPGRCPPSSPAPPRSRLPYVEEAACWAPRCGAHQTIQQL